MNKAYRHITTVVGIAAVLSAAAQSRTTLGGGRTEACGVTVERAAMTRNGDLMSVDLDYFLQDFKLKGDRAVILEPVIINGEDSLALDPVGLYSRLRWYQYLRSGKGLGGDAETSIRWSERPERMNITQNVTYQEWMNGAQLWLRRLDYGCCRTLADEQEAPLTGWREVAFVPVFRFVRPMAEAVKMRELSGQAYVDFPVNRTEIYPEYRKNPVELAKIIATIDSVRNDADVTVKRITIKGYASPESPWDNNTRLAKGRTATLKQYVRNLYHFEDDFIQTDYEPEDWAGLRAFVAQSGLEHKDEILALIDDDSLAPDPKEDKLKKTYPEEYRFLLETVYPGLRHSDYTIEYTIRSYTDVEEIRRIMAVSPQKLSLGEMFLLAQSLEEGSDEYNEVFETAVRMYPNDPVANLNAANVAMDRNDLRTAERYLEKAGDGAEAVYARGVLAALRGDYDRAAGYVEQAGAMGLGDTAEVIDHIREAAEYQN